MPPESLIGYDRKRRYKYMNLEFWAEGGLIAFENQVTSEYVSLTQEQAIEHFKIIVEQWEKADKESVSSRWAQTIRDRYRQLLLDIKDVLIDAKMQGNPTEAVVIDQKTRAELRSALANIPSFAQGDTRTYVMPGGGLGLRPGGGARSPRRR